MKNLFRLSILMIVMLFLVAICNAQPIIIKFSHITAAASVKGLSVQRFKDLVDRRLKGKVDVQIFPSAQLYSDRDSFTALRANAIQMICPGTALFARMFPELTILDLPYLFLSHEMAEKAFNSPEIGGKMLDKVSSRGMLGLGAWASGFRQFGNSRRPIKTLEDYKGLKVRIPPVKPLIAMLKHVKANPVIMPWSETPTALEQKTIDAIEPAFNAWESQKLYELVKYMTVTRHHFSGYFLVTNASFWKGLPSEVRAELKRILVEISKWQWDFAKNYDREAFEKIKGTGLVEIYEPNLEHYRKWAEEFKEVHKRFEKSIDVQLLNSIYALQKEMS